MGRVKALLSKEYFSLTAQAWKIRASSLFPATSRAYLMIHLIDACLYLQPGPYAWSYFVLASFL